MFQNLFTYRGRMRRLHFGLITILSWVIIVVLFGVLFGSALASIVSSGDMDPAAIVALVTANIGLWVFAAIIFIPLFIIGLLAQARRYHDMGYTAWLVLVVFVLSFIPIVGGLIALAAFIAQLLVPGTDGPNKYGPNPKTPAYTPAYTQNPSQPFNNPTYPTTDSPDTV